MEDLTIRQKIRLYRLYFIPVVVFIGLSIFMYIKPSFIKDIDRNTMASISATLAGFLLTALNFIITLPKNRFISELSGSVLFETLLTSFAITISVFLICTILSLLNIFFEFSVLLFLTFIVETITLTIHTYKISSLSKRSG